MTTIDTLEKKYKELGKEIAKLKRKAQYEIDFSKMPKGVVVEYVCDTGKRGSDIYKVGYTGRQGASPWFVFKSRLPIGKFYGTDTPSAIKLAHNPIQPWFGGECPLPDNVRVRYWTRDSPLGCTGDVMPCERLEWKWDTKATIREIIAYQILESDWQDV